MFKSKLIVVFVVTWMIVITALGFVYSKIITEVMVANSNFQAVVTELRSTIDDLHSEIGFLKDRMNEMQKLYKIKSVKTLDVTAYSPRKQETDNDPYINASMRRVKEGTIAVSRDLFKEGWVFGKKVYIEGYGIYEIADLMNERFKNRIDIFMWSTKQAKRFGKKKLKVALLDI